MTKTAEWLGHKAYLSFNLTSDNKNHSAISCLYKYVEIHTLASDMRIFPRTVHQLTHLILQEKQKQSILLFKVY